MRYACIIYYDPSKLFDQSPEALSVLDECATHDAKLQAKQEGKRSPSEDELAEDAEAERPNGTDTVR